MALGSGDSTASKTNTVSVLRNGHVVKEDRQYAPTHISRMILAIGKVTGKTDGEGDSRLAGVRC